jgi:hypothetical protein
MTTPGYPPQFPNNEERSDPFAPPGGYAGGGQPYGGYSPPPYPAASQPGPPYRQPYAGKPFPGQGDPGQPYPGEPNAYAGYPAAGSAPYGYMLMPTTPPPKPVRPPTVTAAAAAFMLIGLGSIASSFVLLNSSWWNDLLTAQGNTAGVDARIFQSIVTTLKVFIIGSSIVVLGLYALFAFKMWIGRNWARITITIFAALATSNAASSSSVYRNILAPSRVRVNGTTIPTGLTLPPFVQVIGWVTAAVALAAIVLMYLRPSNKFFTEARLYRMYTRR